MNENAVTKTGFLKEKSRERGVIGKRRERKREQL